MQELLSIAAILAALAIGAVSPGPSFVVVARTSIAASRRDGLASALGMGGGGVVFATLALLGLHAALAQVEWLHLGLRILGGLFLLHLATRLWRGASDPVAVPETGGAARTDPARAFRLGLATQLSNPKTAIVYASIFAALLPPDPTIWSFVLLPVMIFLIEAGWYAVVALAFSSRGPRLAYQRSKAWIDRLAAAVMGALGSRLILDAVRSP